MNLIDTLIDTLSNILVAFLFGMAFVLIIALAWPDKAESKPARIYTGYHDYKSFVESN